MQPPAYSEAERRAIRDNYEYVIRRMADFCRGKGIRLILCSVAANEAEQASVGEIIDYVKEYAKQETLGPLKGAGAWLGWGFDVFDGLLFNYVAPNAVPTLLGLPLGSPEAKQATLLKVQGTATTFRFLSDEGRSAAAVAWLYARRQLQKAGRDCQ